jgi:hypothetical protein
MPRKAALIRTLNKQIRHVLDQILGHEPTILPELFVIEKRLRIILPKHENTVDRKQEKQVKTPLRWWVNNTKTDGLPSGWRAEVIDLATYTEREGGGGGG